jgi:hypothetical protein
MRHAAVVATLLLLAAVASATAGAPTAKEEAFEDVVVAWRAEHRALEALIAGDVRGTRRQLQRSLRALGNATEALRGEPQVGPIRGDIRQARNKDEVALDNLDRPRDRARARTKINEAIVRKESALHALNRPPVVTELYATFEFPVTTYHVAATDPDGDLLEYEWSKTHERDCGSFTPLGSTAEWSHPHPEAGGDCPSEDVHPGTIAVVVTDGFWRCRAVYPYGSAEDEVLNPVRKPCTPA